MRLPVDDALPTLRAALAAGRGAVLQAPPGAGKTTRVPLALLDEEWLAGRRIVMLEPRRLAARAAARRMADALGERPGGTVGYRTRFDSAVGAATRIEVVTEAILTRRVQADPGLEGVGLVIFDEFHERNLQADLGLALCLEARAALRDDLRILVMSATLDGAPVAQLLGDAPLVTSTGEAHAVETVWRDAAVEGRIEPAVAATVRRALAECDGDVLVFLPGEGEIRRVESLLDGERAAGVIVAPLFGALPAERQDVALAPAPPGKRKVVLATAIAETSLTLPGIRAVVDSGLARIAAFDPGSGMGRLVTERVSQAGAAQRQGRAGRTAPGRCYRLWPRSAHGALAPFARPEILMADLAPLALDLAQWGARQASDLRWLDQPPPGPLAGARELLSRLGALDVGGAVTAHGRAMAALPCHPRLAHMLLHARELGLAALACDVAALLEERDVLRRDAGGADADLRLRLALVHGRAGGEAGRADAPAVDRVRQASRQFRRLLGVPASPERGAIGDGTGGLDGAGILVALAYPERIAQARAGARGSFRLASGRAASLPAADALAGAAMLAVADLDGDAQDARIRRAAAVEQAAIESVFAAAITDSDTVAWDRRSQDVLARRERRLFALVLKEGPARDAPAASYVAALIEGIRARGLDLLAWTEAARQLRHRVDFLRRSDAAGDWPDWSDAALLADLDDWLAPFLDGMRRVADLGRVDVAALLGDRLAWDKRRALDRLAPTHMVVPSGSRVPLDYGAGDVPVLAVRLQEMLGCADTPRVADGRVPVLLHLLSPARRPLHVTRDLAGFWSGVYRDVRADMRGQYPRHPWPEDPLAAEPTARAKPRAR
ncbi:MAG: ATP-dependent helicase HrpB [Alphaproteobacteria bacterium]|nr:ATP-dependent helicase HrpB [Alphaproteobacteria bacterium]